MTEVLTNLLLSLASFIGVTIIYFLKMSFAKLETLQMEIQQLKIEIEKLKLK
jgi:hypothetical protein